MWILILALYASPYAGNAFSTLHTQEFDTATACQQAAKQFTENFKTVKDMDAKAIFVKKS
ncbi:hypothetical protein CBG25_07165 [Arsenophonus sp. ENCA]|uniref:hypothetical protein n=1 Tax=Arsenophonus sp. ENCA TaxID=1987579 RepID=UPI000BCF7BCD|nr:hypothetical protein [Arsenophonus sp. ENCA]PAV04613.1 hypothetical protein CBG25_07165 [Arsenophonus sp. ENCA]